MTWYGVFSRQRLADGAGLRVQQRPKPSRNWPDVINFVLLALGFEKDAVAAEKCTGVGHTRGQTTAKAFRFIRIKRNGKSALKQWQESVAARHWEKYDTEYRKST
jgi:hypothetical protein